MGPQSGGACVGQRENRWTRPGRSTTIRAVNERYAGHHVWEGARGTNGRTFPFWQRHRYTRSQAFPRLHVVLAGKEEPLLDNRRQALTADVQGIAIAVWVNTLPRLQRGEPWYEIGVDDPDRRRQRYPEPAGR
jgi:hypothetical protein